MTPLLDLSTTALSYCVDELSAHRMLADHVNAVNRFAGAVNKLGPRLLLGYPARSPDERKRLEKLTGTWQRLPLYLQHLLVGWAREGQCDAQLAALVGGLPEPETTTPRALPDPVF
jgi:hypothetical protein